MIEEAKFKRLMEEKGLSSSESISHLRSISKTIDIYEYHKEEAYAQIQNINPKDTQEALMLVFSTNDTAMERLSIQANVQAALHNARAVYDLLAQLINKALLNNKFTVKDCSLHKVRNELADSELKQFLLTLNSSQSFKYVNAFVNTIKHRDLVNLNAQIDFVENRSGIRFSSFIYEGKEYPSLWAEDALQNTLNVKNDIITLGEILERHLG